MLGQKRIPSREGGVEIVVEELSVRMASLGHDITVYNRSGHNVAGADYDKMEYQHLYDYKGVHIKTVKTSQKRSLNAVIYSFFATLQAAFSKAEVIHFHAEGPCAMIPIAKLFGKKCVATIHGLDWQRAKWGGFATRFLLFGERKAAKHADAVIVLSKGVQNYFKKTYNRDTVLIPNGIHEPVMVAPQMITQKYGLNGQDYILFLARLVPEKGVHTLIEAYEKSKISIPLVIAGGSSHSGEYETKIKDMSEQMNQHNGQGKVILTGFVQGQELEELYSNALLYVLPSEIEGMPLSLLEAMSYGCLCLTSDIPENTDVTRKHGLSFKTGSVDSLQSALCETIDNINELRQKELYRKETIKQYILGQYNWDEIVKRTLQCYEDINCK